MNCERPIKELFRTFRDATQDISDGRYKADRHPLVALFLKSFCGRAMAGVARAKATIVPLDSVLCILRCGASSRADSRVLQRFKVMGLWAAVRQVPFLKLHCALTIYTHTMRRALPQMAVLYAQSAPPNGDRVVRLFLRQTKPRPEDPRFCCFAALRQNVLPRPLKPRARCIPQARNQLRRGVGIETRTVPGP
jgi:hypothetical protein